MFRRLAEADATRITRHAQIMPHVTPQRHARRPAIEARRVTPSADEVPAERRQQKRYGYARTAPRRVPSRTMSHDAAVCASLFECRFSRVR